MLPLTTNGAKRTAISRDLDGLWAFRVFHDFGLLREVSLWLLLLADEHGIPIPDGNGTAARHARVRAIEEVLARTKSWPEPLVELTETLLANPVLDAQIRRKLAGRNVRGLRRDELLLDIKVKLLLITLRNSFFWCQNHWYGFLNQHVTSVTGRTERGDRLKELLWADFYVQGDL